MAFASASVVLFHDAGHRTYASIERDGHRETLAIRSPDFRRYVSYLYYLRFGTSPRGADLTDFQHTIEGQALFEGRSAEVHVRVAATDTGIVVDLGDPDWTAVEVDARGWRLVVDPPVMFIRPSGTRALPRPAAGGQLDALRPLLNVFDDDAWVLLIAFLIGTFMPAGPYPLLALHGEQGSAKSTVTRLLRSLVDPREALDRAVPKNEHDLVIHASRNRLIALDNVSALPDWLSDGLARLSTGSGFATRQLYTDSEEVTFKSARPVILNGIGQLVERSDLLDRTLLVRLKPISTSGRRLESEIWARFEVEAASLLGCLLDAVACAIGRRHEIDLSELPRMADFAVWVAAAEPALGWSPGTFQAAYAANRSQANELALESDPISKPLRDLVELNESWEGTATELLVTIGNLAGDDAPRRRSWPQAPNALSNRLDRLSPNLRAVGIVFERGRRGSARTLLLYKSRERTSRPSSPSSARSATGGHD